MSILSKATSGFLILFSSISLITKFEYQIIDYNLTYLKKSDPGNKKLVHVGLNFYTTKKDKKIYIPLLYTNHKYTGPYQYGLNIYGPIDDFNPKEAFFLINGEKKVIDIKKNNWKKEKESKERTWFIYTNEIDINWNYLESLKLIVEFTGVRDGKETQYKRELIFEKRYIKQYGNIAWYALKSMPGVP